MYAFSLLRAFVKAAVLSHNGASVWGTLQALQFPEFLTSNPLPSQTGWYPWGNKHDQQFRARTLKRPRRLLLAITD